jgi:hypothetical protein
VANKPGAFAALQTPFLDPKTNQISWTWLQLLRVWQRLLSQGFDPDGSLTANISQAAVIIGRAAIGILFQHIDNSGVVQSAGLVSATDAAQGAVVLPAGATSNTLGSAAIEPSGAFDPTGAAASAQTAAEAHADAVAATAQSNAETTAAANLASAFAPGISVTVTTAQLTSLGAQGSMTFTNGLLTAQVQAT